MAFDLDGVHDPDFLGGVFRVVYDPDEKWVMLGPSVFGEVPNGLTVAEFEQELNADPPDALVQPVVLQEMQYTSGWVIVTAKDFYEVEAVAQLNERYPEAFSLDGTRLGLCNNAYGSETLAVFEPPAAEE